VSVPNNIYINGQKLFIVQTKNRDDCDKNKEDEMSRTRSMHARSETFIEDFSCEILRSHVIWGDVAIGGRVMLIFIVIFL
jgi:hypothetical protein